jgi:hypothetical protein
VKRKWDVRRSLIQRADAQRRWDIVYQRLVQWTQEGTVEQDQSTAPMITQEIENESRHLCPRLDATATPKPNN